MLEVRDLKKYYKTKGGVEVHALDGVSIQFPETGMVFLLGKSGSGKSTLLNVSGGLDIPDSGEIIVKGKSSKDFSQSDFDSYRNTFVGFVFQEYNILNEFNIETNIALALELQGKKNDKNAVNELLKQVDLEGLGKRKPNTLSGGQKQRIAIARALIKNPEIIMADEPTGALDSNTGKQVLDTLKKLSETKLVIIVSHDRDFAEEYADRIIELKDGKILSDHSKNIAQAENISENVRKIGDGTIQIKDISKLSEMELAKVIKSLKGSGEVIISNNENNVTTFKKVAKISDDGAQQYFKDTDLKKIDIKTYDGSETKFIKSKLPGRHALKMGASNLKIKPGRLVFTMFLSIIAFSMFGVLSSLMLYNPAFSYSKGIQEEAYQSLAMEKKYIVHRSRIRIDKNGKEEVDDDDDTNEVSTNTSKEDIEKLNQNNYGLDFAGIYSKKISLQSCIAKEIVVPFYKEYTLNGLSDCGEEYLLRQPGFERLAGHYPTNENELALTEYQYKIFEKYSFKNLTTNETVEIKKYDDLIGQEIPIILSDNYSGASKSMTFTICGIYKVDTGLYDNKYEPLWDEDRSKISSKKEEELEASFDDVYNSSFSGLGFVSSDFYSINKRYLKQYNYNSVYLDGTSFYGMRLNEPSQYKSFKENSDKSSYYPSGDWDCFNGLTVSQIKQNKTYFTMFDINGNVINDVPTLNDNEVMLNLTFNSVQNSLQNMSNYVMGGQYGAYDRDGNIFYYTGVDAWDWVSLYLNYDNLDLRYKESFGYDPVYEILLGDEGEVLAYKRTVYYGSDPNDWKIESEPGYTNQTEVWIDKDNNYIGDNLTSVKLTSFFYDAVNKKPYLESEVVYDSEKGKNVVKTNHDIVVSDTPFNTYYLDTNGVPQVDKDGTHIIRNGLFVNPLSGELSLEKKSGSVFTDNYYIDTNNKIYIGLLVNNAYGYTDKNGDVSYYYYQNGCPLGAVNMNGMVYRSDRFLADKSEVVEALARYFSAAKQSWSFDELRKNYPDIDIDKSIEKDFGGNDLKIIIQAMEQFKTVNTDPYATYLTDELGITTKNLQDYGLKVKGFFLPSSQINCWSNIILNDNWVNKIIYPDDYHSDQYQWRDVYQTKYKVDESAQYDAVISLTDKSTAQLKFMTQNYDDDSFYFLTNKIFETIYFLTNSLRVLKTVFLIVGLVMAGFSGLMLLNFISTSISAKQREIGILRAVGARSVDVFKIYFSEAGIICLICFLFSGVLGGVGCFILNKVMAEEITLQLFEYGPINLAIILGVAFIVGLFGTILPVVRASKKPPVESIRAL